MSCKEGDQLAHGHLCHGLLNQKKYVRVNTAYDTRPANNQVMGKSTTAARRSTRLHFPSVLSRRKVFTLCELRSRVPEKFLKSTACQEYSILCLCRPDELTVEVAMINPVRAAKGSI